MLLGEILEDFEKIKCINFKFSVKILYLLRCSSNYCKSEKPTQANDMVSLKIKRKSKRYI